MFKTADAVILGGASYYSYCGVSPLRRYRGTSPKCDRKVYMQTNILLRIWGRLEGVRVPTPASSHSLAGPRLRR
jgi:hypothetical protein